MFKTYTLFITLCLGALACIPRSPTAGAHITQLTPCGAVPESWRYTLEEHPAPARWELAITTTNPDNSGWIYFVYTTYWEAFLENPSAPAAIERLFLFTMTYLDGDPLHCDPAGHPQLLDWMSELDAIVAIVTAVEPHCEFPAGWVGHLEFSPTSGFAIEVETNDPNGGFLFLRDGAGWVGFVSDNQAERVKNFYHFSDQYLLNGSTICDIDNSNPLQAWLAQLDAFDESIHSVSLPIIIQ